MKSERVGVRGLVEVPGAPQGGQGKGRGGHRQPAQTKFKTAAEMNFNYHSFQQGARGGK